MNFKAAFLTIFFLFPFFVFAQINVSVFPTIIQEKAKARDVLEYKIKIKNLGNNLYHFYTLVEDLGEKEIALSKWVEIFRARTEILAGQEKEIPLKIKIPSRVKPGSYFAEIVFAQGSDELDAKEKAKTTKMPKVLLNIIVEETIVEKIQVKKFQAAKNFFLGKKVNFKIELENIGNREVEPKAQIIIYGKRGEEISQLELAKQIILAGEIKSYEVFWEANKFGKFKAVLFGEYGKNNEKTFQDTTFFQVLSWQYLILSLFLFLVFLSLIVWIFSKTLKKKYAEFLKQKTIVDISKKYEKKFS